MEGGGCRQEDILEEGTGVRGESQKMPERARAKKVSSEPESGYARAQGTPGGMQGSRGERRELWEMAFNRWTLADGDFACPASSPQA